MRTPVAGIATVVAFSLFGAAQRLTAQQRFTPAEIGQIADVVLQALIPPGHLLSCVGVAQRGVFFDHARTLQAFGYGAGVRSLEIPLRSKVKAGTARLLDDCGAAPGGGKPCALLGSSVYAWIEPISLGHTTAVRAHIYWPDRGTCGYATALASKGRASFVGFAAEVYLARSARGGWRFVRTGTYRVS